MEGAVKRVLVGPIQSSRAAQPISGFLDYGGAPAPGRHLSR